jgi:osmotically-inducible protein OsmY
MRIFTSLNRKILSAQFFFLVLALPLNASVRTANQAKAEQQIQDQLQQKFAAQGERFAFVTPTVGHGTITLNGIVQLYRDKLLAEELTRQSEPLKPVFNRIEVLGDVVSDQELRECVAERLKYGAADLGISFPRVTSEVHSGSVHLTGDVPSPQRALVLEIVAETPGVTAIRDEMVVRDSWLDRSAILNAAKKVYSRPEMAGYVKEGPLPIRIFVRDGKATLLGAVNDEQQRKAVAADALGAYGVVSVENQLGIQPQGIGSNSDND